MVTGGATRARSFAIIGSGIAGLLTAHGLRKAGHSVTLYSDRTSQQWVTEHKPTGAAGRFDITLQFERDLGLNHWEQQAPKGRGIHLTFCQKKGNRLLTLTGKSDSYFQALDVRLQSSRWMQDLEARGGRVVIESVTTARLDAIAAEHDLAIVAGGRTELSRLFERDAKRSVYAVPQRKLAMVIAKGGAMSFRGVPFLVAKFNLFAEEGETFWVPYFHKDVGPTWALAFEAKPGRALDRFSGAKSGEEVLRIGKQVIRDLAPWDWEWARDMELSDDHGWLVGGFAPTVRAPVGRLPSGRLVTPVGDAAMSLDPVGGQGANNGTKMARNLVERIVAHGDRPFDEEFLTATFEAFYRRHGGPTYTFNNLLLEPMTDAGKELLIAQYGCDGTGNSGRQRIANALMANFNDPERYTPAFQDMATARALIEKCTGRSWIAAGISGRLGVARAQLRQLLGRDPGHPFA